MSPGKLPHAKRFNVQKDERTDRLPVTGEGGGGGSTRARRSERKRSRLMTILYIRISSSFSLSLQFLSFVFLPSDFCAREGRERVPLGPLSVIAFLNSMLVAPRGEWGKNFSSNAWRKERKGQGLSRKGGGGSRSSGQDGRIRSNFLYSFSFSSALGLGWPITWRQI